MKTMMVSTKRKARIVPASESPTSPNDPRNSIASIQPCHGRGRFRRVALHCLCREPPAFPVERQDLLDGGWRAVEAGAAGFRQRVLYQSGDFGEADRLGEISGHR